MSSQKKGVFSLNIYTFALIYSILNIVLYNIPLLSFAVSKVDYVSTLGIIILFEVFLVQLLLVFLLIMLLSFIPYVVKTVSVLLLIGNSFALYFVNTYNILLDRTMMGNVFNTNTSEATDLYSFKLLLYVFFLGILPSIFIIKVKINNKLSFTKRISITLVPLLLTLVFFYINSKTWLWIDKNASIIGGLSMPFSYTINSLRYKAPQIATNTTDVLLPLGSFINNKKVVVILVIGESARSANFSLYGYKKNTNPNLVNNRNLIVLPNSTSCATYTTAAINCILSYVGSKSVSATSKQYEALPSYLTKHQIKTVWRTINSGDPAMNVDIYQKKSEMQKACGEACTNNNYDELLNYGLKDLITDNLKNNTFIVLHQSVSHGPSYYNKYPSNFEKFTPVCKSVELQNCSEESLINAYDNTILYTDYLLQQVINILEDFKNTPSVMIYISDHGESLGEYNTYLHGMPYSIAPKVQKDIPFIVWMSDDFMKLYSIDNNNFIKKTAYSQDNIFYSVMGAFGMRSEFYNKELDIFNVE